MRFASRLVPLFLLLSACTDLQREFQGPARLELAGVKEGACATVEAAGRSATRCGDYTFRFTGLSGKLPVRAVAVWQGVEVQGYQGEVELFPGSTARVEVERKTLSLRAEAPWAGSAATYEAWVDGAFAFGVAVYPDPPPSGLEGMVLVHRGGPELRVPTAPRAVVRVRDGAGESRVEVAPPAEGLLVRVPEPRYAPIRLTPEGVASRVACVAALLGGVEAARSCTPPFGLAVVPPDGEYREVVLVAYADGFPFQEGRVLARSGESRTVALARKRVQVELTAPGFTADTQAVGEAWLRPEDQEGVPLYGDAPPAGYEGYRLADRALVVNGVAALSVPTGRMVLFRMVGAARTAEGVVDLVDADRRVVLP
ncbi:hypothetical protein [Thermus sp.]|jgi:hypothetical protein|uniref:hypothetical protein n=1 Tax=Thermus sp. TaxID=275 RepID=UPI003D0981D3